MNTEPYLLIPLRARDGTIRAHALIDEQDAALAEHRWRLHCEGYAARTVGKQTFLLHRVILGLTPGDGLEGDHENGDRLDCRRSNLRVGTRALNGQNMAPRTDGHSMHRGVSWHVRDGRWQAQVRLNGKRITLGYFDDEQEAADAARAYRLAHMPFTNEARRARPS